MRVESMSSLIVVCLALPVSVSAQEVSPAPSSVVKVYRVADLVALQAVRESTLQKTVTTAEWSGEHPQSIESLNNLVKLIDTIVPAETGAVAAHEDTLSLVVRHTTTGHGQVAALLDQLREQERPVVELKLIPIVGLERSNPKFTDEQTGRLEMMLHKQILNPEETQEMTKLLAESPEASNPLAKPITAHLANGRKTLLPRWMMPMSTTAVLTKGSGDIQFRLDNWADEASPGNLVAQSQSFSVPSGHSVIFATAMDGSAMYWLAVPKKIEPELKVTDVRSESKP